MTETSDSEERGVNAAERAEVSPSTQAFRIGNVVKVVLPLLLLGVGAVVFIGFFDGVNWLSSLINPPLVSASGQVMYQGKPLEGAQVTTRHTGGKLSGAIGATDDQGRFTLRTDINGYVDGAYAGEHEVAIAAYHVSNAIGSPPLRTPQIYASPETTPLRIVVSKATEKNKYVFTLEGNPSERPGGSGGGFNPEAIVGQVFEDYDQDGDQQLSADEMQVIEADRLERILRADANEDGVVERDELLRAFAPSPPQLE